MRNRKLIFFKANWRMLNKEYLVGAELGYWFMLYDDERDKASVT